jgi:hypothetical protein
LSFQPASRHAAHCRIVGDDIAPGFATIVRVHEEMGLSRSAPNMPASQISSLLTTYALISAERAGAALLTRGAIKDSLLREAHGCLINCREFFRDANMIDLDEVELSCWRVHIID